MLHRICSGKNGKPLLNSLPQVICWTDLENLAFPVVAKLQPQPVCSVVTSGWEFLWIFFNHYFSFFLSQHPLPTKWKGCLFQLPYGQVATTGFQTGRTLPSYWLWSQIWYTTRRSQNGNIWISSGALMPHSACSEIWFRWCTKFNMPIDYLKL